MMADQNNLPKLSLTTSASHSPFSSSVAFSEIAEFVHSCLPDAEVQKTWGTLFVVSNDLDELSSTLGLTVHSHLLMDDSIVYNDIDQRVIFVASGGPAAIILDPSPTLSDAMKLIIGYGYGNAPAVLVHTSRTPRVYRFFEQGIVQPTNAFITPVGGAFGQLVLENLPAALDWVEENSICPAWNIDELWQIPDKFVPQQNAERRVQNLLRNGLAVVLGKAVVLEETSNDSGRADVVILPSNPKFKVNYIELKVVKTYHSVKDIKLDVPNKIGDTKNRRWALSAIRQAAAYRGKNPNADAHARIYDMRKERLNIIPDEKTKEAAHKRNVTIKARVLYPTTEGIQEETAAAS